MSTTPDTTTVIGEPIVVHDTYRQCNVCGHEYRTVSDGYRVYAEGEGVEVELFSRTADAVITGACGYVNQRSDVQCTGEVSIDLTTNWWEPSTPDRLSFLAYGERIEV